MKLNSCVCGMKIYFNFNSQGYEKIEFFSKDTYYFQILRNESLIIAGYEDIKISIFHQLAVKLWLKENDLHTNNSLISIQIHTFRSANIPQNSAFLSHDFAGNLSNADVFTFSKSATNKVSFPKLKVVGPLREKVQIFILLGIKIENNLNPT